MTIKDYGFLVSLLFLALTGLATLFTRTTPAYGLVLIVHLAAIGLTFAAAPYSKFVHLSYRFLALVRDSLERAAA
jgi:citrate/tricarballylate utilization protein